MCSWCACACVRRCARAHLAYAGVRVRVDAGARASRARARARACADGLVRMRTQVPVLVRDVHGREHGPKDAFRLRDVQAWVRGSCGVRAAREREGLGAGRLGRIRDVGRRRS